MRSQSRQQILDLNATVNHQAARFVTQIQLGVVLHVLDEVQLILREDIVALHGRARLTGY
jgi:hypothetical protein